MTTERYIRTEVVERLLSKHDITVEHCSSCHSEWDYGIAPMECELGKGRFTYACCGMIKAIDLLTLSTSLNKEDAQNGN